MNPSSSILFSNIMQCARGLSTLYEILLLNIKLSWSFFFGFLFVFSRVRNWFVTHFFSSISFRVSSMVVFGMLRLRRERYWSVSVSVSLLSIFWLMISVSFWGELFF